MNSEQAALLTTATPSLWERHMMALDDVTQRLNRITQALTAANVPYALVGGQAVALWVASIDPAAVRTTKDVNILLDRNDLPTARAAAHAAGFDYFETMGVGMFLERTNPNPRLGVHICWAGEKIRPQYDLATPAIAARQTMGGCEVVSVKDLVVMKLQSNRDQDRVHLRDMIDVGLIDRQLCDQFPTQLQEILSELLTELGR